MKKFLVLLTTGLISFLVAFSLFTREEITEEVEAQLERDFQQQCEKQFSGQIPDSARIEIVCRCMKSEFEAKGYSLTDAFGGNLAEMQRITRSCSTLSR